MSDAQDTARRLCAIRDELSERFYERADVVRALVVALPAGQHSLVRGWNDAGHRLGFRLSGVAIATPDTATGTGSVPESLCDTLRTIDDLTDVHATADLFRVI
ncbi:hypothetical protein ACE1N8_22345 [Streptomyces sp. DSM 116494]|uniref:hypothetical protein n=1 Tax=Streptomyces okerensis TaxID=3344655 RepID=UPI00388E4123